MKRRSSLALEGSNNWNYQFPCRRHRNNKRPPTEAAYGRIGNEFDGYLHDMRSRVRCSWRLHAWAEQYLSRLHQILDCLLLAPPQDETLGSFGATSRVDSRH